MPTNRQGFGLGRGARAIAGRSEKRASGFGKGRARGSSGDRARPMTGKGEKPMRMVRVTIEYDMDDLSKPLHDELTDWINNSVNLQDVMQHDSAHVQWATPTTAVCYYDITSTVRINELDSQGEVK